MREARELMERGKGRFVWEEGALSPHDSAKLNAENGYWDESRRPMSRGNRSSIGLYIWVLIGAREWPWRSRPRANVGPVQSVGFAMVDSVA